MSNNYRNTSVNSISEAIKWAINNYGKEIVKDSNRFKSILMDLYEFEERELNLIKLVCNSGIYATIINSLDSSIDLVAKKMIKDLREFYGIANPVGIEIINWLLFALDKKLISDSAENLGHSANKTVLQGSTKTTANKTRRKTTTKVNNSIFTFEKCSNQDAYMITSSENLKGKIVIPSEYNGQPVVEIGTGVFENKNDITEVIIPDGVKKIGKSAFSGCSSLKAVKLPDGIIEIGCAAFSGCSSLETINIPNGIKKIEISLFFGCSSLEAINLPDGITEIGENAFLGCSSLKTINIPNSVMLIKWGAFENCSSLETIYIPKKVQHIEKNAFKDCKKLIINGKNIEKLNNSIFTFAECSNQDGYMITNGRNLIGKIVIPSECNGKPVVEIGEFAFKNKNDITEVIIPNSIKKIANLAFSGCSNLETINIQNGLIEIGMHAFEKCSRLETINMPDSVKKIGESAFKGCVSLVTINLPDGIMEIGDEAFLGCSSLEAINIPDNVTKIGESVFEGCSSLKTMNLPDGVTKIEGFAFWNCSSLETINIPDSVTKIGWCAFWGCFNLEAIYIPKSVRYIGKDAFSGCKKLTISAETKSKPIGWIRLPFSSWNPDKRLVKWGE